MDAVRFNPTRLLPVRSEACNIPSDRFAILSRSQNRAIAFY
ncbi:MAG: hypothetical protein AB1861_23195 [Cyanobacteriota bacterium]